MAKFSWRQIQIWRYLTKIKRRVFNRKQTQYLNIRIRINGRKMNYKKEIARERINTLLKEAENSTISGKKEFAKRYVYLARRIAMRYRIKIPREKRMWICKNCYSYLCTGVNCRIRIKRNTITIFCEECKSYKRFGKIKEKRGEQAQTSKRTKSKNSENFKIGIK